MVGVLLSPPQLKVFTHLNDNCDLGPRSRFVEPAADLRRLWVNSPEFRKDQLAIHSVARRVVMYREGQELVH